MFILSELVLKLEPKHKIKASCEYFYRSDATFENNTANRIDV